ncbi:MAG: hypothetical protein JXK50_06690 [Campylobacterales bacterium]|nr:hypothetical protein [Campylobacterales bacterium]
MKQLFILFMILVVNVLAIDVPTLFKAHQEALKVYQANHTDFNIASEMLEKAGIKEIIHHQPSGMSKGQYVQLLNDYGYFLTLYNNDYAWMAKFHCDAKVVLERVKEIDPKRASVYLNLGDLYLRLYLVDENRISYPNMYVDASCAHTQVVEPLVSQAKQMYLEYERLMKEANRSEKIPERLKLILSNDRVYMVRDLFRTGNRKKEETELCQLYVDTLNRLPESERISDCDHNISTMPTEFEKVPYEALSDTLKKRYQIMQKKHRPTCGEYRYKETIFMDYGGWLFDEKIGTDGGVFCEYKLLDFTKDESKKQGEDK